MNFYHQYNPCPNSSQLEYTPYFKTWFRPLPDAAAVTVKLCHQPSEPRRPSSHQTTACPCRERIKEPSERVVAHVQQLLTRNTDQRLHDYPVLEIVVLQKALIGWLSYPESNQKNTPDLPMHSLASYLIGIFPIT